MTRITLFADFICPFCYATEHGLLPQLDTDREPALQVRWRPFELHPETPPGGAPYPARDAGRIWASARRIADDYDLPIARKAPTVVSNTRLALAGAEAARAHGVLPRYRAATYRAFFVERLDLGDPMIVQRLLPEADPLEPRWEEQVQRARADALARNVTSAPAFVMGERVMFGLQDIERFEDFLSAGGGGGGGG